MTQLPLFRPTTAWAPPVVSELPSWSGAKRVSIDIETRDERLKELGPGVRRGAYIVGISFAIEDGPAAYLPIRHQGGDNLEPEKVLGYVRDQAREFRGTIVGAGLGYDLDFLAEESIEFPQVEWFRDVLVADPLLNELHDSYSLESVCARHGYPGKDMAALNEAAEAWHVHKDPRSNLWRLPGRHVAAYGIADAQRPLQVLRTQERRIEEHDLWRVWNTESKVLPIAARMRRRGLRVDMQRLANVERWTIEEERKALAIVKEKTGLELSADDVWIPSAIAPALEKATNARIPRTPKTGEPSINKQLLKDLKHPVADAIMRARKVNKLRTTFVASIRKYLTRGDRIHSVLNQLRKSDDGGDWDEPSDEAGAVSGRFSSEHPNLQQQPSPGNDEEIGKLWRSIYLPEEGGQFVAADYSQQEPRLIVHYATLKKCVGAAMACEEYRKNPKLDYHGLMSEWSGAPRKQAKIVFLARCYGMGEALLCTKLGFPTVQVYDERRQKMVLRAGPEGLAVIRQFDERVPFAKQLARFAEDKAKRDGWLRTLGGRVVHFPPKEDGSGWDWTYKALNRLVQGSAADQTKEAMIALDAAGFFLQLQVHDELDGTAFNESPSEWGRLMEEAVPIEPGNRVDVEVGPSWGEAA